MKSDKSKNRIPSKNITPGTPIILQKDSPDLIFLNPKNVIIKDGSGFVYDRFSGGINIGGPGDGDTGGEDGEDTDNPLPFVDTVDMSDIESITFEEYIDPTTKITKYNAIIKIRNGSVNASSVVGVDARIYDSSSSSYTASTASNSNSNSPTFITPTPTIPSVIFDRTGSAIAWGWNDASGLGSFESVTYQWTVTTLKTGGTTIASGTKNYPSSYTYAIGDSGKNRKYRVSSGQGDLPASSSARWLKVRTVVTGTNNKKYYSNYSTAI